MNRSSSASFQRGSARLAGILLGCAVLGVGAVLLVPRWLDDEPEPPRALAPAPSGPAAASAPAAPAAALSEPEPAPESRVRYPLQGVLLDDATGEPIPAFTMSVIAGAPPADAAGWPEETTYRISGPNGDWSCAFLAPGTYSLRFVAAGHDDLVVSGLENPMRRRSQELRMRHGTWVHGVVRDARGQPVPALGVRLVSQPAVGSGGVPATLETTTDESGAYSFSSLAPGPWRAEISGLEGVVRELPSSEPWTLEQGQEVAWDATLPELSTVALEVKWLGKRPVFARTEAVLTSVWGGELHAPMHNGVARFEHVAPGLVDLTVGKPGETPWYRESLTVPLSPTLLEWKRSITPPERERPEVATQQPGRKKGQRGGAGQALAPGGGGAKQGAGARPGAGAKAGGAAEPGAEPGTGGKKKASPAAGKGKRKKKDG